MELGLKNKTALVTGGATGIGEAITLDLAKEGVNVIFSSRNAESIDKIEKKLSKLPCNSHPILGDVTDSDDLNRIVKEAFSVNGTIDILVNNVGHTLGITDPYCSLDDWHAVMKLNFEVAVEASNLVIPAMKKQDWGRIVHISAGAGLENSGPVTYSVSKAALVAYTRTMGRILATETTNVVMSSVLPGIIITEQGHWAEVLKTRPEHAEKYIKERSPLGRFGEIHEISPMVTLLCSELASFCQGAIVPVDAGQGKHYMSFNYL